jgi:glycosyltransferase involved in cell wall biosynthesis
MSSASPLDAVSSTAASTSSGFEAAESEASKPRLLIVKGTFEQFGGAERDLLRNLTAWSKHFDLHLVTLNLPEEAREMVSAAGVNWMTPVKQWKKPQGVWAEARAKASRQALSKWLNLLSFSEQGPGLKLLLQTVDAVHITSGVGSLEIVPITPDHLPLHLHLLEPPRGLYEEVLHRLPDGTPKRNLGMTKWLLSKQRNRDQRFVRELARTGIVSGNSRYIQKRIGAVYDIEAQLLLPSVDITAWGESHDKEWNALSKTYDITARDYVVTVGRVSFVKGTWETISMLRGSDIALAHVGGGIDAATQTHAAELGVRLVELPRLSDAELIAIVRNARAVVSHAHGEPFGLTPIEAQAAGTPALMVDDGGFRYTIEDGVSGRLLPRDDLPAWHKALDQAANEETRSEWAEAGRANITQMGLTPADQAKRLQTILGKLIATSERVSDDPAVAPTEEE